MANGEPERKSNETIFIYRKPNGGAHAWPSPKVLVIGQHFWMVNATEGEATVTFPDKFADPPAARIPSGRWAQFVVMPTDLGYHEYDVEVETRRGTSAVHDQVYGGSRPGAIIDG